MGRWQLGRRGPRHLLWRSFPAHLGTDMSDAPRLSPDPLIVDTAERVLARAAAGSAGDARDSPDPAAWREVEATGLATAWVREDLGGAGADQVDALAVARAAGRHAPALPLAETLLAGWLLDRAGLPLPGGALAPGVVDPDATGDGPRLDARGRVHGRLVRVPWAGAAGHLVLMVGAGNGHAVVLVERSALQVAAGRSLAGEPLDTVTLDGAPAAASAALDDGIDAHAPWRLGALVRAQQMAGALERILDLSLDYARERVQFGRPIARFQAVQHELAKLAGECAAAGAAAGAGAAALARHGIADPRTRRAVAVAKIRVGEAAGAGAAIAHQVHGAMGFSQEYLLHRFTRRLWSWRDDYGGEATWARWLGRDVAAAGARALWPGLTG